MLKEVVNTNVLLTPGPITLFQVEGAHLLALKLLISDPTDPGWEILYCAPILST